MNSGGSDLAQQGGELGFDVAHRGGAEGARALGVDDQNAGTMPTGTALVSVVTRGNLSTLALRPTDYTALAEAFQPQGNILRKVPAQAPASEAFRHRATVREVGWQQVT